VRADLDPEVKREVRERLLALRGEPLAQHFVRRFVPPPDYSPIAEALRRLQRAVGAGL
jgi:hypothetical protein